METYAELKKKWIQDVKRIAGSRGFISKGQLARILSFSISTIDRAVDEGRLMRCKTGPGKAPVRISTGAAIAYIKTYTEE